MSSGPNEIRDLSDDDLRAELERRGIDAAASPPEQVVRRRRRAVKAAPLPEEQIPTKQRLLELFTVACSLNGDIPDSTWRKAVVRLRISRSHNREGDVSDAPVNQMEDAAEICAKLNLFPEVLIVEFGQTAYVAFDEEAKRPEFNRFLHEDIPGGGYDGFVLVAQRIDRLARTLTFGSLLIERCIRRGIDILEFANAQKVASVPQLSDVKYVYYDKFEKAQAEWELISARQSRKRAKKIQRGEIAGNVAGIGHLEHLAPNEKGVLKVTKVVADPLYQPVVAEAVERIAAGEKRHAIAVDFNRRVASGTLVPPPPQAGPDGEDVTTAWLPNTISRIVESPRLIGCQVDEDARFVRTDRIEPLVGEDLWYLANAKIAEARKTGQAIERERPGPKPGRIGTGILSCRGCGCTGKAGRGNTYRCSCSNRRFQDNTAAQGTNKVAADGNHHFNLPGFIDDMLREVTIRALESIPELAARAQHMTDRHEQGATLREALREERRAKTAERVRVIDMRQSDLISKSDFAERVAQIDADLTKIAEKIAESVEATSILDSLAEGETWRSRWEAEYEKPDRSGVHWIRSLLLELWERVDVDVGAQFRGRNVFHEGRLTFVGRAGFAVSPEAVAEIARELYAKRMTTISTNGWADLTDEAKQTLFKLHHEASKSLRQIATEMNELANDNSALLPRQPLTAGRAARDLGVWTASRVNNALRQIYAEREMTFRHADKHSLPREDRDTLRRMVDLHGEEHAAELMQEFGKAAPDGGSWTAALVRKALAPRPERYPGRTRQLTTEMVDVAETLQLQGRKLREIKAFFASQPDPIEVSEATLSRRLNERRRARRAELSRVENEAA